MKKTVRNKNGVDIIGIEEDVVVGTGPITSQFPVLRQVEQKDAI